MHLRYRTASSTLLSFHAPSLSHRIIHLRYRTAIHPPVLHALKLPHLIIHPPVLPCAFATAPHHPPSCPSMHLSYRTSSSTLLSFHALQLPHLIIHPPILPCTSATAPHHPPSCPSMRLSYRTSSSTLLPAICLSMSPNNNGSRIRTYTSKTQ